MKISKKLVISHLGVGLIPVVAIGGLLYITTQRVLNQQISSQLANTLTRQTNKVNSQIQADESKVGIIASYGTLRVFVDQYVQTHSAAVAKQITSEITTLRSNDRSIRRMEVVGLDGKVIAATDQRLLTHDYTSSRAFKAGRAAADVSTFFKDIDGIEAQYLAAPIQVQNKTVGIVLLEHQIDSYGLITSNYVDVGKTGETFLLGPNDQGKVVNLLPLRFAPDNALKGEVLSGAKMDIDYRGHPVLAKTDKADSTGWAVGVMMDQAEVYAPVVTLRNIVIIVVLIIATIVTLLVWWLSGRITRPIKHFIEVVERVRAGDYKQRVTITAKDEIGTLGAAFNTMAAQIAASQQILEQKVVERTQALNQKVGELEGAHAKDNAILNSIGDGMVVTDGKGDILLINALAAELLNVDSAKVLNTNIMTIPIWDDKETPISAADNPFTMTLQTTRKIRQDAKIINPNSKHAINITATPVVQQGNIIGVIEIIHDITKEKEVDRMKTEFISLASHQLRTPLSAINWFSEMLLSGDAGTLDKEQQEFVQNISDSSKRMVDLVTSLLNISRMESGRIIVDPKPTDLRKLIQGTVNDLQAKIASKHQQLTVSVHDELPLVNLDPHLIGQVYMNFLTNAIKYTPEHGEISVMVSRRGDELLSQVSDNGYGIPKAQQGRVFQKFFRAENIIKVEADGTGLGLYLVKAVIESSGGKLWFESEEGKGTTFWFTLPMSGMKAKAGEVTLDGSKEF